MFWDKRFETMDRQELRRHQLEHLNITLKEAAKSPRYGQLLKERGVSELKSLDEIQRLPFTGKQDLRDHFPYGFLSVPLDKVVRMHSSSGTTGNPTVVFHTKGDLDNWAGLVARNMYMSGLRPGDVFQNIMGYGLFTGGLGFHYGSEKLGAMTIPAGAGNSKRQLWFMRQFKTTAAHILPSYALKLSTYLAEEGLDPRKDLHLKYFYIGAEPHTEAMRQEIERIYGVKAFNSYGLSEMCGPGVAFECLEQNGMHLWEDHYLMEIIDPKTGELLPDGQEGELVLTSLRREAMPLLRYRTRDLTSILAGDCPCGRTHRRIARFKGRSDDMLIINGVNIFPMQIEATILAMPEVGNHYVIEVLKENFLDRIHLKIEVREAAFSGTLPALESLKERIAAALNTELGVHVKVHLVEPGTLPTAEGKAVRVFDKRNQQ